MQSITVTFPPNIPRHRVKEILEGNLKENSEYRCAVAFKCFEEGENVFTVASGGGAAAFYLIGMTASLIIERYNGTSSHKLKINS